MDASNSGGRFLGYTPCEIRAVIRFLHSKGEKPQGIHRIIRNTYGEICISQDDVKGWCKLFAQSRKEQRNLPRCGSLKETMFPYDVVRKQIEDELRKDPRMSLFTLKKKIGWSRTTISKVLDDLGHFSHKNQSLPVDKPLGFDNGKCSLNPMEHSFQLKKEPCPDDPYIHNFKDIDNIETFCTEPSLEIKIEPNCEIKKDPLSWDDDEPLLQISNPGFLSCPLNAPVSP